MANFEYAITNKFSNAMSGNAGENIPVTVYKANTNRAEKAVLTDIKTGDTLSNPLTTGLNGYFSFEIAPGQYELVAYDNVDGKEQVLFRELEILSSVSGQTVVTNVEDIASIPFVTNGLGCYVIATGQTFIYIIEDGEEDGQWVEQDQTGDDVDITAASYLTLDQAKASDLREGQYVRITDRDYALGKVETSGNPSEDGTTALNNGNFLVVQPDVYNDGINKISSGSADNTLIANDGGATRVHIEPGQEVKSGVTSKLDMMFDPYETDPNNYRIHGNFQTNGDLSGNGRNAESNFTLKAVGDFYGNFPLAMWGYQDNTSDRSVAMKMFYMDIDETEKPTPHKGRWQEGASVSAGDYIQSNNFNASPNVTYGLYKAQTSGVTGSTQPIHTSGAVSDGGVTWEFIKDYFVTASSNKLHAMMLFGRKSDYPVSGGNQYTAQFSRGLGVHDGQDVAHFNASGGVAGRRRSIGNELYDYFGGFDHYYKYDSANVQHVGGGTLRSLKTVDNDDGGTNITIDARGADVINLNYSQATTINSILCDQNQEFRIRVTNDNTVTLVNGPSLRLIDGTQTLGVRSIIPFFARTNNQAIQDGYIGG